jgi:hypothetical protein
MANEIFGRLTVALIALASGNGDDLKSLAVEA